MDGFQHMRDLLARITREIDDREQEAGQMREGLLLARMELAQARKSLLVADDFLRRANPD